MNMRLSGILATTLAVGLMGTIAVAQDIKMGEQEFMSSCAQCHGTDATGNGPMAGYLNVAVPDLTALQRENGGVFPVSRVYASIDGSAALGAHGSNEMPAWGRHYKLDAPNQLGLDYMPRDREAFIRGRILALIEHLSTLQAE